MDNKHLDIITTSLEALLQRGTSPKNVSRDSAAIEAFCGLVNKEPGCIPMAAKLIVSKMQSMQEWEALQALQLLEACMQSCGPPFHAEVGKFRFLNELIKLISPKYLGSLTPDAVRKEIIELLYLWTQEYPKETKIQEAYEMLKKQRVVQADPSIINRPLPSSTKPLPPPPSQSSSRPHPSSSILEDANQAKLLQKLLQSKKPEDLQAANKLIRSMVSEEEKKMEERCKVMIEMDSIKNNVSLLNEMLDNYSGTTSDWELIRELYTSCEGFQSSLVNRVQHLPTGDDDLLQLVISINESLTDVTAKYNSTLTALQAEETNTPLLDVNSARPSPQRHLANIPSHLNDFVDLLPQSSAQSSQPAPNSNNLDLLNDLFTTTPPDSALLSFTTNENVSSSLLANESDQKTLLINTSSLLNDGKSFQPVVLSQCSNSCHPSLSQQIDLMSVSPLKKPEESGLDHVLGLTQPPTLGSSANGLMPSNQTVQSIGSQNLTSGGQILSFQNQSSSSQNHQSQSLPQSLSLKSSSTGNSPTTVNKLKALRDLDEMVGRSLNQMGLNEDVGRKDGDGSETLEKSHDGGNSMGNLNEIGDFVREKLRHNVHEARVTNGFGRKENGLTDQQSAQHVEVGKGDSTLLQEDDEQLLLDDFTLGEAPASSETFIEQDSNNSKPQIPSINTCDIKLSDILISLAEIQPSRVESICALDANNLKILIHLTQTRPKPNIAVFVVSTTSSHSNPLSSYLFQPVLPKGYKLKLQPPSSTTLPPFNPFMPSPAITQIMLIASPLTSNPTAQREISVDVSKNPTAEERCCFKFVVSYEVDKENVTEMGEIAELPLSDV